MLSNPQGIRSQATKRKVRYWAERQPLLEQLRGPLAAHFGLAAKAIFLD